jgi:hypothetical protein
MIIEQKLSGLNNKPIKVNKIPPPQSCNPNLPPLYFTLMCIGSKGSGKTYSIVKLLKSYEEYPIYDNDKNKLDMRVILFCPTGNSSANVVFKTLKYLDEDDIHLEYSDELLQEVLKNIEEEKNQIEEYSKYVRAYNAFKKAKSMRSVKDDDLMLLYKHDFVDPDDMDDKPKYKFPRINFLIFDDLISDPHAFKKSRSAGLNNLTIRHRHLQTNLIFTSQYVKAINPIIRRNIDIYVIFRFANVKSVLDNVYPEVSSFLTEQDFDKLYKYATKDTHNAFICINHNMVSKTNSIRKNWDILLTDNDIKFD